MKNTKAVSMISIIALKKNHPLLPQTEDIVTAQQQPQPQQQNNHNCCWVVVTAQQQPQPQQQNNHNCSWVETK